MGKKPKDLTRRETIFRTLVFNLWAMKWRGRERGRVSVENFQGIPEM